MKKFTLFDNSKIESELGYDNKTGWVIPYDVQSVEFEDGKILINPNFDLDNVKEKKIQLLQSQIIELQMRKDAGIKNGLIMTNEQTQIDALKSEIASIKSL